MDIRPELDHSTCIFLALLFLTVPVPWIFSAGLAAMIHELAHIGAVYAVGGKIHRVRVWCLGTTIDASMMTPVRELLCVLAGPTASLILVCSAGLVPRVALCGMVQGLFNLIPVLPLDGGRARDCLLELFFPPEIGRITAAAIEILVFILIIAGSLWLFFVKKLGIGILFAMLFLLCRIMAGKIPCKERGFAVQ